MTATILRTGLTGNIAAGKSTVAGWMAELGCEVIDADRLARECLCPGAAAHRAVVAAFGPSIVAADGAIDRGALGRLVFADADARRRLESLLHPAIRDLEAQRLEEIAARAGDAVVVTEAALVYETGGAARYHRMVVVTAPDELRLRRLLDSGLGHDDAVRRMESQMAQHEKAARADYVILNGGVLATARQRTEEVVGRLRDDLEALRRGAALGKSGG